MQEGQPSSTAVISAVMRASHRLVDQQPWVFIDELAAPIGGLQDDRSVLSAMNALRDELRRYAAPDVVDAWMQNSRLSVNLRARYTEDELEAAMRRGVEQYVMLGAGLDSFAYRRRDLGKSLQIFELDYPATQESKRARLRQVAVDIPANVTFVPIDFERTSMLEALQGWGYRHDQPTFFSWLGVIPYLTDAALDDTLRQVSSAASGSEIVIDYYVPKSFVDDDGQRFLALTETLCERRGEVNGHYHTPADLETRLKSLGFVKSVHVGPDEANARYFRDRDDNLRITAPYQLIKGIVA